MTVLIFGVFLGWPYLFFFRVCNDCGLYTYYFSKLICDGYDYDEIGRKNSNPTFCGLKYASLLWDYGRKKIDSGALSENEVTRKWLASLGVLQAIRCTFGKVRKF